MIFQEQRYIEIFLIIYSIVHAFIREVCLKYNCRIYKMEYHVTLDR